LPKITLAAHTFGALVGFDLAHAAGNVPLQLHSWEVDFAVWCTYKYLNSGPGGTSGVFVHENHANNPSLPRFAGWWGHDEEERFLMKKGFKPMIGAEGWQLSNAQIFPMAIHMSALDIFLEAGMDALREKSLLLTGFLDYLIGEIISNKPDCGLEMISPVNPNERGCQISILAKKNGKALFQHLSEAGIIADWREPNVIRVAPVPLYNTFNDVYTFAHILDKNL
jgi:kynureninase